MPGPFDLMPTNRYKDHLSTSRLQWRSHANHHSHEKSSRSQSSESYPKRSDMYVCTVHTPYIRTSKSWTAQPRKLIRWTKLSVLHPGGPLTKDTAALASSSNRKGERERWDREQSTLHRSLQFVWFPIFLASPSHIIYYTIQVTLMRRAWFDTFETRAFFRIFFFSSVHAIECAPNSASMYICKDILEQRNPPCDLK